MTTYATAPACFADLLTAAQRYRDTRDPIAFSAMQNAIATSIDAIEEAAGLSDVIGKARHLHTTDEIEIDDNPLTSPAEDGCWVAAWVWVPVPEVFCECANCTWEGPESDLDTIYDPTQRIAAGETTPPGQCPDCGALAQYVEEA